MTDAPPNSVPELPLVLTVEEAAKVLRIGRSSAYEATRTGQLPVVRIGRILRVPRTAIEEMLRASDDGPTDQLPREV